MYMKNLIKINEILIRRSRSVIIPKVTSVEDVTNNYSVIGTLLLNVHQKYGFLLGFDVISNLKLLSKDKIIDWYSNVLSPSLDIITGNNHNYKCMYPGFPEQLMDINSAELVLNTYIHYVSKGNIIADYSDKEFCREYTYIANSLNDNNKKYTILNQAKAISISLTSIFKNLVSAKVSLSKQDVEDCRVIFSEFTNVCESYLYDLDIPNKENLASITKIIYDIDSKYNMNKYYKTATDILRLYVAMSNGDVSLSNPTRFISLNRKYRRLIMDLLNNCNNDIIEDMYRHKEEWLRIGEKIHPFTYNSNKYKKVIEAFDYLRNLNKPQFFNSKIESLIKTIDNFPDDNSSVITELVSILKTRPGEFARRLDKVILCCHNRPNSINIVLRGFSDIADNVPIPILFQLFAYFWSRDDYKMKPRVFFPKGNTAKFFISENIKCPISASILNRVIRIIRNAIIYNLSQKESYNLCKFYIDFEEFKNFLIPFGLRNANSGSKTVTRGSKLNIEDDINNIRLFTWWTNNENSNHISSRIDIDLTCGFYDKDWNNIYKTSYSNLVNKEINSYHSGDIVNGGELDGDGAAEFIDIDIDRALCMGCKYVAFMVNVFEGPSFNKITNCTFGWMKRQAVNNEGEIFEPSKVDMRIDINSNSKMIVPAILDLENRQIIWSDMKISIDKIKPINIENNSKRVAQMIEAITHITNTRPTLYDLIYFNILSRKGLIVDNKKEADIIFSNDTSYEVKESQKLVTAYDIDYYISNMM